MENISLENNNYNFSTAKFDAMQVGIDDQHSAYTDCEDWPCSEWDLNFSRRNSVLQAEDTPQEQIQWCRSKALVKNRFTDVS